jgi:glycosyltransferase involved in cell wall biosynthesis
VKRLLFLVYYFPPIGGGGVQRAVKFVRHLPDLGYEPVVVTGPGGASDLWAPEDRTLEDELPAGVEVVRIPGPEPGASRGWRRRGEQLLELPSPYRRWWVEGAIEAGRRVGAGCDVILGELVPYFTADAAATLARELGKPWVADLQDPWALDEMWLYPSGVNRRIDRARMHRALRSADAVVMNTPEAALRVRRTFPDLDGKLVASIPNGFDAADFASSPPPRTDGAFRIVHTGYLHTDLGLRHRRTRRLRRVLGGLPVPGVDYLTRSHVFLLEAVDRLLHARPELAQVLEVHLAGVLTERDLEVAARSPVVQTHGYVTHAESVALLQTADLVFLPMHDLPAGVRAGLVPGKTYEYIACGRPVLAAVPEGDARDLLLEVGNADVCAPADVGAIARAIEAALERTRAGIEPPPPRADVLARYERRAQTEDLARVLDAVLGVEAAQPALA